MFASQDFRQPFCNFNKSLSEAIFCVCVLLASPQKKVAVRLFAEGAAQFTYT